MKINVALLFMLSNIFGVELGPKISGRIIGGKDVTIEEYPYQVALLHQDNFEKILCGGSILNERIIITAAHCIDNEDIRKLRVRIGSTKHYEGGEIRKVEEIKKHCLYNSTTNRYNIALLLIDEKIHFSIQNIGRVIIPNEEPKNGTIATVTGYGVFDPFWSYSSIQLQAINVTVLSWKECASTKYKYRHLSKLMICANAYGEASCKGDEGGPLVANGNLIGIVLTRPICGVQGYPGVYLNIALVKNWIHKFSLSMIPKS